MHGRPEGFAIVVRIPVTHELLKHRHLLIVLRLFQVERQTAGFQDPKTLPQ